MTAKPADVPGMAGPRGESRDPDAGVDPRGDSLAPTGVGPRGESRGDALGECLGE